MTSLTSLRKNQFSFSLRKTPGNTNTTTRFSSCRERRRDIGSTGLNDRPQTQIEVKLDELKTKSDYRSAVKQNIDGNNVIKIQRDKTRIKANIPVTQGVTQSRFQGSRRNAPKNVSVKNNMFKQQEVNKPVTATFKLPKGTGPKLQASGTTAKVDAATSNIDKLLKWIQKRVNQYPAVDVVNFTTSWEDGIALCALINYLLGDEYIDPAKVTEASVEERFEMALDAAAKKDVPRLLDAKELARGELERKSMIMYLHLVYQKLFADVKEEEKNNAKKKEEEETKAAASK